MNTPIIASIPSTDGTLKPAPHIVAVLVGGILGFLTTKVGIPTEYVTYISVGVTTLLTTAVHFIQAKLAE
jgi:small basic protein